MVQMEQRPAGGGPPLAVFKVWHSLRCSPPGHPLRYVSTQLLPPSYGHRSVSTALSLARRAQGAPEAAGAMAGVAGSGGLGIAGGLGGRPAGEGGAAPDGPPLHYVLFKEGNQLVAYPAELWLSFKPHADRCGSHGGSCGGASQDRFASGRGPAVEWDACTSWPAAAVVPTAS
jgi:hypothetical protein